MRQHHQMRRELANTGAVRADREPADLRWRQQARLFVDNIHGQKFKPILS